MSCATVALPTPSRPSMLAVVPPSVPEACGSGSASKQQEPAVPFGEGRYQLIALYNALLAGTAFLCHLFSVRLTAHVMDHWCWPTEAFANVTAESWKEIAVPILEDGTRSHCTSECGDNIVSEWQLVCQRHWLLEMSLYTNFMASVEWVPMMGVAADRVGRRIVAYVSIPALLITGFTSSLTGSFQFLVAWRTVTHQLARSPGYTGCLVEVTGQYDDFRYDIPMRTLRRQEGISVPVIAAIPFAIFAALKLSWKVLYLVVVVPTSLLVITLYTMDESYLWLLASWRAKEAERLAMRAARITGDLPETCPPETCRTAVVQGNLNGDAETTAGRRPHSIFSAKLRHRTLLISSIWAAINFDYSQANLTDIFPVRPGAVFVGVLLLGPVHAVLCPAIRLVGLRRVIVGSALIFTIISLCLATTYRIQTPLSESIVVVALRLM
ncbi:solute carrier family 22 member 7-like [Dermacentor variabilis]|uniref:solute carrier family 22 member 7-like n=1 Tax=Dermacentor variabilis TaxID=34621 RepID=UPI003F5B05BF